MFARFTLALLLGPVLASPALSASSRISVVARGIVHQSAPNEQILFRHVTPLGTTKPNGAALDERLGTSPALERRSRELDRLIAIRICSRC